MSKTQKNTMIVGILQMELHMGESQSLKQKRMILKSLKDRLRKRFNISVSEIGYQETWQRSLVGVTSIGTDKGYVDGLLSTVLDWVAGNPTVTLISSQTEIL